MILRLVRYHSWLSTFNARRRRDISDMLGKNCSFLVLATTLLALAANGADVPQRVGELQPILGAKGALLLDEKFEGDVLPKGWTTQSGKLHVADGVLHASQTKESGRLCLFGREQAMRDAAIEIDFKFDGAGGINVSMNPSPGELNKHGHLFSVMITARMWNITEHNDKSDPNSSSKALVSANERFEPGRWYTLLLETKGEQVVAQIEGKQPLRASSKDFAVKKPGIEFRVAGRSGGDVCFDNLRVWELKSAEADLPKAKTPAREETQAQPPPLRRRSRLAAPAPSTRPSASPSTTAPTTNPAHASGIQIQITSEKSIPINPKIYGVNCAEMFIFDLVQNPEYLSALDELKLNTFLFPGGSTYHHPTGTGGFNIREDEIAQSKHGTEHRINKPGSPDFFLQYVDFMKPMGGHAVFIPNIAKGTVQEMEYYLKKMTDAHIPIEAVVLGMEVQLGAFPIKDSTSYIKVMTPYISFLKAKYPTVPIVAWSTPVGRRAAVPESFKQWNRDIAKVPGIDGFAQYGWSEFGGAALRARAGGMSAGSPEEHLKQYDAFVDNFPAHQIDVYAHDWGKDKKMFMLQWGTHADRNSVVEALHMANFYFFMTQYNAAHDNYFQVATWSAPWISDLSTGKRKNTDGTLYKQTISLWTPYLYSKPLRHLYSGDKSLLNASVIGGEKSGAMQLIKVLAAIAPDGKKYVCILNRGPAVDLNSLTIDGHSISPEAKIQVESAWGETLTTTGSGIKTFTGTRPLAALSIEPYSVTTLIMP